MTVYYTVEVDYNQARYLHNMLEKLSPNDKVTVTFTAQELRDVVAAGEDDGTFSYVEDCLQSAVPSKEVELDYADLCLLLDTTATSPKRSLSVSLSSDEVDFYLHTLNAKIATCRNDYTTQMLTALKGKLACEIAAN